MRICLALISMAALAVSLAHAAGLPDTGQTICYNGIATDGVAASSPSSVSADSGGFPRQDCRYGRDPAAAAGVVTKIGGGAAGLDYTKIANNGSTLAASATLGTNPTDWACTRDNITGLTWEVKTTSGMRNSASTYTWLSSNAATNGGVAGTANGGTCSGGTGCDTEKFVADVNAAALCSYGDWRMPTERELLTLVLADGSNPSIDPTYFPNTQSSDFWSGMSYVPYAALAWDVYFGLGGNGAGPKSLTFYVRLVRGGQF